MAYHSDHRNFAAFVDYGKKWSRDCAAAMKTVTDKDRYAGHRICRLVLEEKKSGGWSLVRVLYPCTSSIESSYASYASVCSAGYFRGNSGYTPMTLSATTLTS